MKNTTTEITKKKLPGNGSTITGCKSVVNEPRHDNGVSDWVQRAAKRLSEESSDQLAKRDKWAKRAEEYMKTKKKKRETVNEKQGGYIDGEISLSESNKLQTTQDAEGTPIIHSSQTVNGAADQLKTTGESGGTGESGCNTADQIDETPKAAAAVTTETCDETNMELSPATSTSTCCERAGTHSSVSYGQTNPQHQPSLPPNVSRNNFNIGTCSASTSVNVMHVSPYRIFPIPQVAPYQQAAYYIPPYPVQVPPPYPVQVPFVRYPLYNVPTPPPTAVRNTQYHWVKSTPVETAGVNSISTFPSSTVPITFSQTQTVAIASTLHEPISIAFPNEPVVSLAVTALNNSKTDTSIPAIQDSNTLTIAKKITGRIPSLEDLTVRSLYHLRNSVVTTSIDKLITATVAPSLRVAIFTTIASVSNESKTITSVAEPSSRDTAAFSNQLQTGTIATSERISCFNQPVCSSDTVKVTSELSSKIVTTTVVRESCTLTASLIGPRTSSTVVANGLEDAADLPLVDLPPSLSVWSEKVPNDELDNFCSSLIRQVTEQLE